MIYDNSNITFVESLVDVKCSRVAVGIAISQFMRDYPYCPIDILIVSPEIAATCHVDYPPNLPRYIMESFESLKMFAISTQLPKNGWYITSSSDSSFRYSVKWPDE